MPNRVLLENKEIEMSEIESNWFCYFCLNNSLLSTNISKQNVFLFFFFLDGKYSANRQR